MKPTAALLVAIALTLGACTEAKRTETSEKAKEAYADSKTAVANAWTKVKSYTYEKRMEFTEHVRSLSSDMEVKLAEVRASYSDEKASAARKAAMAELRNAEADYKEKLAALGNASAATWEQAKQNVILAWERLQAAYRKARAD
jgi:hypothetical protein